MLGWGNMQVDDSGLLKASMLLRSHQMRACLYIRIVSNAVFHNLCFAFVSV